MTKLALALAALLLAPGALALGDVVYVDASAPGPAHDGTSWATAFDDLQAALAAAGTARRARRRLQPAARAGRRLLGRHPVDLPRQVDGAIRPRRHFDRLWRRRAAPVLPLAGRDARRDGVFLLRGKHGSAFNPSAATGAVFCDVSTSTFLAKWMEELKAENITGGCGAGTCGKPNSCVTNTVTRGEMAAFIRKTFGLP